MLKNTVNSTPGNAFQNGLPNGHSNSHPEKELLNHPAIWCAGELTENPLTGKASSQSSTPGIDTGFAYFNQQLADAGWPSQGITEILYDRPGTGELSILLPLLRHLSQGERWLVWVAPPFQLHTPALLQAGVDSRHILQITPQSGKDRLWCTEEALKSAAVSLVLSWPGHLKAEHVRRLQIISNQYQAPCVLFREQGTLNTPCALRIHIRSIDQDHAHINILKRRRGWPPPPFTLRLRNCPGHRYQNQRAAQARAAQITNDQQSTTHQTDTTLSAKPALLITPGHPSTTALPAKNNAAG
jgi:cell division inhibitor SulA